jgi:hypothetical protein
MVKVTITNRNGEIIEKECYSWEIEKNCFVLNNEGGKTISAYPLYSHALESVIYEWEKTIK